MDEIRSVSLPQYSKQSNNANTLNLISNLLTSCIFNILDSIVGFSFLDTKSEKVGEGMRQNPNAKRILIYGEYADVTSRMRTSCDYD